MNKYIVNVEIYKIKNKQDKLRQILQNYDCEEWGDCIINDICDLFEYPNTNIEEVD